MKDHINNPGDIGKRYRRFLTSFLASVVLLFLAMSGSASAANIFVNSTADDGSGGCTLREAIENANNNAQTNADCVGGMGADTITFTGAGVGTILLVTTQLNITDAAGLTIDGGGAVTISGNNLVRVFSVNTGASLTLENLTVKDGNPGAGLVGGGIVNLANGIVTITNSTLSGNSADRGGGIYNLGTVTITNSTLSGNSATSNGGGIFNDGTLTITNSTLSGNSANFGGGILNTADGTLTITNSTLSGNSATTAGGGIFNSGNAILTITNSTLSGNSAAPGAGGGIITGDTATITNSIVANSPSGGDCSVVGTFTALGNNLHTDGTCPSVGQVTSDQLNLGPLGFYDGGTTRTYSLRAGSFAINFGVQDLCADNGITTDQNGVARDTICDVGSFEFVAPPPPPPADLFIAKTAAKTAKTGKQLTYTINVTNNGPNSAANVVVDDVMPAGTTFVSVSAPAICSTPAVGSTATVSCSYGTLVSGASIAPLVLKVKITATGNAQLNNTATVTSTTFDPNLANNSATATSKLGK